MTGPPVVGALEQGARRERLLTKTSPIQVGFGISDFVDKPERTQCTQTSRQRVERLKRKVMQVGSEEDRQEDGRAFKAVSPPVEQLFFSVPCLPARNLGRIRGAGP